MPGTLPPEVASEPPRRREVLVQPPWRLASLTRTAESARAAPRHTPRWGAPPPPPREPGRGLPFAFRRAPLRRNRSHRSGRFSAGRPWELRASPSPPALRGRHRDSHRPRAVTGRGGRTSSWWRILSAGVTKPVSTHSLCLPQLLTVGLAVGPWRGRGAVRGGTALAEGASSVSS